MLPGLDGFEALRELRARSRIPVLMLTGRGEEPGRIVGLELGADDYLPKTFSTRELLARLRSVIRRSVQTNSQTSPETRRVVVGELQLDCDARVAFMGTEPLQLTATEFDLLLSPAKSRGRIKSREQLLLDVADRNFDVFDRSVDVHISSLRKKLRDDPKEPKFIVTVRSAGYMMRKPGTESPV
jgi:DNA-binding response OmpR family regulator